MCKLHKVTCLKNENLYTAVGSQIFLHATASQFTVGIPCGGLRSVIALVTLIAALAYLVQGSPFVRLLLLTLAVPIALAANIVRLVILFGIANQWGAAGREFLHFAHATASVRHPEKFGG